ncbi:MAG: hypothetical protein IIY75_05135, partial [Erysipelotrichales bacterium]|nr:hypothetical protein [Erysipelotrichales bacterium]
VPSLDVVGIVIDLRFVAGQLLLVVGADTSVGRHTSLLGAVDGNPKAVLVKCVDRCHNLTNMAWGLSRERITRMILETEEYYPKLLDVLKSSIEYNDAAWLLKYQIESMLDIYKRLL